LDQKAVMDSILKGQVDWDTPQVYGNFDQSPNQIPTQIFNGFPHPMDTQSTNFNRTPIGNREKPKA